MIVLISSNRCNMVGVGLGEPRKGENELSKKKEYFSRSNTIELVVFLGIRTGTPCYSDIGDPTPDPFWRTSARSLRKQFCCVLGGIYRPANLFEVLNRKP
jgi:hypothetical protein